jgi:regulator of protease activity HflC (stomatin/prohibitin superfamily)
MAAEGDVSMQRALAIAGAFALFMCVVFACSCERIDVGNVGIKINTLGDVRGAEHAPTVSGWVWYSPFSQDVIEFPTTVQTVLWQKPGKDASYDPDESISFGSREGMNVNVDVSVSFQVIPDRAPRLYAKYRQPDLDAFAHGFLRNQVKDALQETASRMPIESIYGEAKGDLIARTKSFLAERLEKDGIRIEQLTFNSNLRLPENVQKAIDMSIAQIQEAQRAQYRVKQVEAEAHQVKAKADGEAQAAKARADAQAYATRTTAEADAYAKKTIREAEAKGNEALSRSITPSLVDYERAVKWDGKLPVVGSGSSTLVDLRSIGAAN